MEESYGKVIITWNPKKKAPRFPAQEIQVQHPFMVNTHSKPRNRDAGRNVQPDPRILNSQPTTLFFYNNFEVTLC